MTFEVLKKFFLLRQLPYHVKLFMKIVMTDAIINLLMHTATAKACQTPRINIPQVLQIFCHVFSVWVSDLGHQSQVMDREVLFALAPDVVEVQT